MVLFYPDPDGIISEMKRILSKDPAAGNRYLGKQIFTLFHKSGAKEVYINDDSVSTANCVDTEERAAICDAYFSYLEPEFLALSYDNPKNSRYKKYYEYLRDNYERVLNIFRTSDFYFRAGYISGYGFYKQKKRRE